MSVVDLCLIRSRGPSGEQVVRLGGPLVDDYLEFLQGRCRPNTVLAAAYDLRVFFTVVAKPAAQVVPADVLGFITAQRTGWTSDPNGRVSGAPTRERTDRGASCVGGRCVATLEPKMVVRAFAVCHETATVARVPGRLGIVARCG
jgi:hypothetical protein